MHWLDHQIFRLHGLSQAVDRSTLLGATGRSVRASGTAPVRAGNARHAFVEEVRRVVEAVATRAGVTACFASHDGLLLASAGAPPDADGLSAMSQTCAATGASTADALGLGPVRQIVVVGEYHKLAVLVIGQLAIGILAPASTHLSTVLAWSDDETLQAQPHDPRAAAPVEASLRNPQLEKPMSAQKTLLEEIGGHAAVELVVADFYERVLADLRLARYFRGVQMSRLQQLQTDFFCHLLDPAYPYRGRDMRTLHQGMQISNADFDAVAGHLTASLHGAGVPAGHVTTIIGVVASFRDQIVERAAPVVMRTV